MIKVKFSNPTIVLNGKETIMTITALLRWDKLICYTKRFTHKITLKNGDKYDLNKAKNILQTYIEQRAYLWAKKVIDKQIEKEQIIINDLKSFSEKAIHIIEHDSDYLNNIK